ncbi:MAG TPA: TfoX/Sxy family protein [Rhabdochlamydiaceae bacterium]
MATRQSTIDFILEHLQAAGEIRAKKMFGEYGIFCSGKMVALVCGDQLFVKPTLAGAKFIGNCVERSPYPGSKPCFLISRDKWADSAWLTTLIQISARELPLPKKKSSPQKKIYRR